MQILYIILNVFCAALHWALVYLDIKYDNKRSIRNLNIAAALCFTLAAIFFIWAAIYYHLQ